MQPLQLIKLNSTGDAVVRWQNFLLKQGYIIGTADGTFGTKTDAATKAFQTQQGLMADGVVGNNTYAAAMKLGFNAVLEIADFTGIDVYHDNGNINWDTVKADEKNIRFVYVKATEGATVQDDKYVANIQGATAAGFATGAYHFFSLTTSAQSQAANFIQQVGDTYPYKLPPALDYEKDVSNGDVSDVITAVAAWLKTIQDKWGISPVIYTSVNYWSQLGNPPGFDQYGLWLANYNQGLPPLPGHWAEWAIWQYKGDGSVQGITGEVDLNKYNTAAGILTI